MATRTSVQSGKWSAASTWDTGVPADGDAAVIAAGHTVIFDVDQSAFATGVTLTINGTLQAATDMRVSGDGNGTIAANNITGLTRAFMTASDTLSQSADASTRSIYASVVDDGGGHWHIDLYKEVGRTTKIAHTGDITADGTYTLTADGGSGVGGTLTVANFATIAADSDITLSGVYYWKNGAANVTFGSSGQWNIGTAEVPYPAHLKFVANLNGDRQIVLTGTYGAINWYCAEPTTKYVALSASEAAGQTELSVASDVTGEGDYWFAGAEVRIDHVRKDERDTEARTLSAVAADTVTVTSGLTGTKASGSLVILITRNIRVIGLTGGGRCFHEGTSCVIGAELRPASGAHGIYIGIGFTVSGTISGCSSALYYMYASSCSCVVSGCSIGLNGSCSCTFSGTISGCATGIHSGTGNIISGLVSGCTNDVSYGSGHVISGTISGGKCGTFYGGSFLISGTITKCQYGICYGGGHEVSGSITGNGVGVNYAGADLVNATFSGNSSTDVAYTGDQQGAFRVLRSFNHNGTVGDRRSYSAGGYGAIDATVAAPGFSDSYKLTCTTDSYWNHTHDDLILYKDRPAIITLAVKNGATGMTGRARFELIASPSEDPFFGGTPAKQYVAPDDTDWHIETWVVHPTVDTVYKLRFSAKNGSGNAWGAWRVDYLPMGEAV